MGRSFGKGFCQPSLEITFSKSVVVKKKDLDSTESVNLYAVNNIMNLDYLENPVHKNKELNVNGEISYKIAERVSGLYRVDNSQKPI